MLKKSVMALSGIKVIEMAGLAPGPFCGMVLSDFGAKVIRIDRTGDHGSNDTLMRGKQSIAINLKVPQGVSVVKKLCTSADVLIEPFRPGVMEKLGLGPEVLLKENPALIYARLTGFGQSGYYAERAGHDINYLAVAGVLSKLGRKHENPMPPINLLADFAGGGMICAFGILMALFERTKSGQGQIIDANMVEGAAYISSFLWKSQHLPIWSENRGEGMLDGGAHFYDTYKTADGKYMAVGALEPQFYHKFIQGLGLSEDECPQYGNFDELREKIADVFASKTRSEWCEIFDKVDACVTPVLERDEASQHPHNAEKKAHFRSSADPLQLDPRPAPNLSRSPGRQHCAHHPQTGENTVQVLKDVGYSDEEVAAFMRESVVEQRSTSKL